MLRQRRSSKSRSGKEVRGALELGEEERGLSSPFSFPIFQESYHSIKEPRLGPIFRCNAGDFDEAYLSLT